MRRHLYTRKRECGAILSSMTLTKGVKEMILNNRNIDIYKKEEEVRMIDFMNELRLDVSKAHFSKMKEIKELLKQKHNSEFYKHECFLLQQLYNNNNKEHYLQLLHDYYLLLACFNVYPYVKGHLDNEILYSTTDVRFYEDNNVYSIEDEYLPIYNEIKNSLSKNDIKEQLNSIIDAICT